MFFTTSIYVTDSSISWQAAYIYKIVAWWDNSNSVRFADWCLHSRLWSRSSLRTLRVPYDRRCTDRQSGWLLSVGIESLPPPSWHLPPSYCLVCRYRCLCRYMSLTFPLQRCSGWLRVVDCCEPKNSGHTTEREYSTFTRPSYELSTGARQWSKAERYHMTNWYKYWSSASRRRQHPSPLEQMLHTPWQQAGTQETPQQTQERWNLASQRTASEQVFLSPEPVSRNVIRCHYYSARGTLNTSFPSGIPLSSRYDWLAKEWTSICHQ